MTLRQEIPTALDEVTPPAPHLRYTALDAAAAARPVRRRRVVSWRCRRLPPRWLQLFSLSSL